MSAPMTSRGFIDACENERLHRSGAIQPHGALLVCDAHHRVTHVSVNLDAIAGPSLRVALGESLPAELARCLQTLDAAPASRQVMLQAFPGRDGTLDLIATRTTEGASVIELLYSQPLPADGISCTDASDGASFEPLLHDPDDEHALAATRQQLVETIGLLSGFERVLYYGFRTEGDGEVSEEWCADPIQGRYKGLRFPASDIPRIARALYLTSPWRSIPHAAAPAVDVLGLEAAPPDLSFADLRSLSPVHQAYMHNMGVAAAVSLPIVVNGELVALISCHASQPRQLPLTLLQQLAARTQAFSLALQQLRLRQRLFALDRLEQMYQRCRRHVLQQCCGDLQAAWPEIAPWLLKAFMAEGVVICHAQGTFRHGQTLEPHALTAVDAWLCSHDAAWLISDNLQRDCPAMPLSSVAGLLGLRLDMPDASGSTRLYFCRSEHVQEVAWGGNPDKPVEYHRGTLSISPRRSFEKWVETRLGFSRPWPDNTRLKLLKLRALVYQTLSAADGPPA